MPKYIDKTLEEGVEWQYVGKSGKGWVATR